LAVVSGNMPCIVTASHVVKDMQKSDFSFISIDGNKFKFEHLDIYFNDKQDYAIIPIPEKIKKEIPQSVVLTINVIMEDMTKHPHL